MHVLNFRAAVSLACSLWLVAASVAQAQVQSIPATDEQCPPLPDEVFPSGPPKEGTEHPPSRYWVDPQLEDVCFAQGYDYLVPVDPELNIEVLLRYEGVTQQDIALYQTYAEGQQKVSSGQFEWIVGNSHAKFLVSPTSHLRLDIHDGKYYLHKQFKYDDTYECGPRYTRLHGSGMCYSKLLHVGRNRKATVEANTYGASLQVGGFLREGEEAEVPGQKCMRGAGLASNSGLGDDLCIRTKILFDTRKNDPAGDGVNFGVLPIEDAACEFGERQMNAGGFCLPKVLSLVCYNADEGKDWMYTYYTRESWGIWKKGTYDGPWFNKLWKLFNDYDDFYRSMVFGEIPAEIVSAQNGQRQLFQGWRDYSGERKSYFDPEQSDLPAIYVFTGAECDHELLSGIGNSWSHKGVALPF